MKVILNDDVKHLGEIGDVKNVANGYARNYLFPRSLALPYNPETAAFFEGRKAEIEARKEQKRKDSKSLKEKLEALEIVLSMPCGNNGKLYGAVTSHTISEFYASNGYEVERKRIEIPGLTVKQTGAYAIKVHLYETTVAEVRLVVNGQADEKSSAKPAKEEKKADKAEPDEKPAEEKAEQEEA